VGACGTPRGGDIRLLCQPAGCTHPVPPPVSLVPQICRVASANMKGAVVEFNTESLSVRGHAGSRTHDTPPMQLCSPDPFGRVYDPCLQPLAVFGPATALTHAHVGPAQPKPKGDWINYVSGVVVQYVRQFV
jgi:hypothetical protein